MSGLIIKYVRGDTLVAPFLRGEGKSSSLDNAAHCIRVLELRSYYKLVLPTHGPTCSYECEVDNIAADGQIGHTPIKPLNLYAI